MRPTNDEFIDSAHSEPSVTVTIHPRPEIMPAAQDDDYEHKENCDCVMSFFIGCGMGALALAVWICIMTMVLR